jgi:hypothetical protein
VRFCVTRVLRELRDRIRSTVGRAMTDMSGNPMREWTFDRFRNGQLLAEAASTHADSQAEAEQKVRARYARFRSCARDTYVLRTEE